MRDLYQDMILSHNKAPRNKRVIPEADRSQEGFNPLCGDRLSLQARIEGGRIADIAFTGHGCAIDTASASMMTEAVKGKTLEEAEALYQQFHHLIVRDAPADPKALGKLAAFSGVGEFPARVKCATLPWHTLRALLKDEKRPVSTE